jgi:chorismate synthase
MSSSFGQLFRVTTFGESHGAGVGVVIDGLPGNMAVDISVVQEWLDRRRPGQSNLTSPRAEQDLVECLSGLENGRTLGGPVTLFVRNTNIKPDDYRDVSQVFRPGHADFTTLQKYGVTAHSGGGRASARETVGRVAAGAVAWQMIRCLHKDFEVVAWVRSVKDVTMDQDIQDNLDLCATTSEVDKSQVRCPELNTSKKMVEAILDAKNLGDSLGGTIRCVIRGVPTGLGEPVFDKLEADLAKAIMSLPASKGFEIGSGFSGTKMTGSEHNDALISKNQKIATLTNRSGGIVGGISNGEFITLNVAFKPVSTIFMTQTTVDKQGNEVKFKPERGRHDPCVLPRAVPMVEAMATLVIADHILRQRALSAFTNLLT